MAIRRTPKASTPKAKPKPRDPKVWKPCVACGVEHEAGKPGSYVMPALLDPTAYACSKPCYDDWCESRHPKTVESVPSPARDPGPALF